MPLPKPPTFISFSRNCEDVIINRVFKEKADGFYVDVGAAHPIDESDTKALYDRGWKGINIEPEPKFFAALAKERTRDINLNVGVAKEAGSRPLFIVEGTGLSTFSPFDADAARDRGHDVRETISAVKPLRDILAEHDVTLIDLLKVDVEGLEREVLESNDWTRWRPTLVLAEATFPETSIKRDNGVSDLMRSVDYRHAYFDGLNDFYVECTASVPDDAFNLPPNIWDDFERHTNVLLQEASREANDIRERYESAERYAHSLKQEIRKINDAMDALQTQAREHAEAAVQHASALERRAAEAEQQVEEVRREANDIRERHESAERYAHSLTEEIRKVNDAMDALQAQASEQAEAAVQHASALEQRAAEAEQQVEEVRREANDIRERHESAERYAHSLTEEIRKVNDAMDALQAQAREQAEAAVQHASALEQRAAEAEQQVEEVRREANDIRERFESAERYAHSLTQEIRKVNDAMGALQTQAREYAEAAVQHASALEQRAAEAEQQVQEVSREANDIRERYESAERYAHSLKQEIHEANDAMDALQAQARENAEAAMQHASALEQRAAEAEQQAASHAQGATEAKSQLAVLAELNIDTVGYAAELLKCIQPSEPSGASGRVLAFVRALQSRAQAGGATMSNVVPSEVECPTSTTLSGRYVDALAVKLLTAQIDKLGIVNTGLEVEVQRLTKIGADAAHKIAGLHIEIDHFCNEIQMLQNEIRERDRNLAAAEEATRQLRQEMDALRREIDRTRLRLDSTLSSTSWKITGPLRRLVKFLRGR